MNKIFAIPGRGQILWLFLLVANATAMTIYFRDPNRAALSSVTCVCLFLAAWGTVFYAWRLHRRELSRCLGRCWIFFAVATAFTVNTFWATYFSCPPSPEVQHYLALTDAINANDLARVNAILAQDHTLDFVPTQAATCYVNGTYSNDCDVNLRPFDLAFQKGEVAIAATLLEHGASQTLSLPLDSNALTAAAERSDIPMMQMLLQHGAKINDADGNSLALWMAVEQNKIESVKFLLAHGANANTQDPVPGSSYTVLQFAHDHSPAVVTMLKEAGAKLPKNGKQ